MNRASFLLKGLLPAAVAAGAVAARVDPDGEPLPESAPLIVLKGNGTSINNVHIDATKDRRTAIRGDGVHGMMISNVSFKNGATSD